jgi:ATP/ADP translocase
MFDVLPIFGLLDFAQIWLAVPLVVAFSFVYAATRSESPREILRRASSVGFWLFFFLALVAVILRLSV